MKWPKVKEVAAWQQLDKDLISSLEHSIRGRVKAKLNSLGDILYEECRGRFGAINERPGQLVKG